MSIGNPIIVRVVQVSLDLMGVGMLVAELLRDCVMKEESISLVARESGVSQATLQEFVVGKSDGTFADLRLSSAEKLISYFGIDQSLRVPGSNEKRSLKMLLASELKACDCSDSPEKFKERLIDGLSEFYPGQTIDGLVCTPIEALDYCNKIREGIGSESLADIVILKTLMNIRKAKNCPSGLRSKRTRRVLSKELQSCGCELSPASFKELVGDCLADMYKSTTIDEIVCHPRQALALCNHIRMRASCGTLSDRLILSTLMNARKAINS